MLSASPAIEDHADLLKRLDAAREQTDRLFDLVQTSALYARPIPERHRIVFYRGHLEAFDWNLLQPQLAGVKIFDASLDRLFAFGIDPVDGELPSDTPADWPREPQVEAYVSRIRAELDGGLPGLPRRPSGAESSTQLLNVALEHRLMHAETLAYMLHQLPLDQKRREPQVAIASRGTVRPEMVHVPAGRATLGLPGNEGAFGWDNEFEQHSVAVPPFSIGRFKVTNGQFFEFMQAGGYQQQSLWTKDAWTWIRSEHISHPVFWEPSAEGWLCRTMFEKIPLPLDWPVSVSHAEASAFAQWSGMRLPAEAEWHRAAYGVADGREREFPWGSAQPESEHGYFDFRRWDPWPLNAFPAAASAFGAEGLLANGWEWTSTQFQPFAGFQPFPFYPGYSANFFDGKHFVMKGGSTRTAACMLRRSFRNWFQPHYQYVYAGFRCARD